MKSYLFGYSTRCDYHLVVSKFRNNKNENFFDVTINFFYTLPPEAVYKLHIIKVCIIGIVG